MLHHRRDWKAEGDSGSRPTHSPSCSETPCSLSLSHHSFRLSPPGLYSSCLGSFLIIFPVPPLGTYKIIFQSPEPIYQQNECCCHWAYLATMRAILHNLPWHRGGRRRVTKPPFRDTQGKLCRILQPLRPPLETTSVKTHSRKRLEVRTPVPLSTDSLQRKNNSCVYHGNLRCPSKLTDSRQGSESRDGPRGATEQKEDGAVGKEERERERVSGVEGCEWISAGW